MSVHMLFPWKITDRDAISMETLASMMSALASRLSESKADLPEGKAVRRVSHDDDVAPKASNRAGLPRWSILDTTLV
jgi:hypothetical protein